jgi:hypothetical protein
LDIANIAKKKERKEKEKGILRTTTRASDKR